MKYAPAIAGGLLGLLFAVFSLLFLLKLVPMPELTDDGSAVSHFMAAFVPTGYLAFVKVCELIGGVLVAVPRTRNLGLLVLGPIIVNIIAFHAFVTGFADLLNPIMIIILGLTIFLLWVERRSFMALVWRPGRNG
jgi:hypothetical protein